MKKNNILLLIIIIVIISVISIIYFKGNGIDEKTARCIAEKSELYTSRTCSHCAQQKEILGNYSSYFTIIDCLSEAQICQEKNIQFVPAWIISNNIYTGVKTLEQLKELTGC